MPNSILTIDMITREAVRLWKNSNEFIQHIEQQYDSSFAQSGAKIGATLRVRLPNDFTVRTGPAAQVQDTQEQSTTLVMATQKGVDLSFSSVDRTLSMDDFSRRFLAPAINNLAGDVAADIMKGVEGGVSNFVANRDTSGVIIAPTSATWLEAGAMLDIMSSPRANRKIIMDPMTQARTVSSLSGLFNPSAKLSEQYRSGIIAADTLGFDWFSDQTVIKHTTSAYSGTKAVAGAGQTGSTLLTAAITGGLNAGDIITIGGVFSVNRITKESNGVLAQFVVTANVATGGTSVPIYPAIIPPVGTAPNQQKVQYQTVTAAPAASAPITVVTATAEVYRKNFAFCPEAVTMATADLELPTGGVIEAAREQYDGISMRMISAYNIATDQFITRLDVLYGYKWVRPEWACAVADAI